MRENGEILANSGRNKKKREEWWKKGRLVGASTEDGIEKEFELGRIRLAVVVGGIGGGRSVIGDETREGADSRAASLRVESTAEKEVGWRAGVSYRSNYLLNWPDLFL